MSFEDIIRNAGERGWAFFEGVDEQIKKRVELKAARTAKDKETVAAAWRDFAATPGGKLALQYLFDSTLNRTVYFVNMNLDPLIMANWGSFREGQNAVADEIARQIYQGRENQPKPRNRP